MLRCRDNLSAGKAHSDALVLMPHPLVFFHLVLFLAILVFFLLSYLYLFLDFSSFCFLFDLYFLFTLLYLHISLLNPVSFFYSTSPLPPFPQLLQKSLCPIHRFRKSELNVIFSLSSAEVLQLLQSVQQVNEVPNEQIKSLKQIPFS